MEALFINTLNLALESAPWLLLGLVAAGLIHAWLPMESVGRSLGGSGLGSVTRAALIGAPLPLCSCSALPAAIALRRSGASRASTTSFLVSTPETGVDSIAISWVLLGPLMALLRPVAAVLSAVAAGLMVGRSEISRDSRQDDPALPLTPACGDSSCCASSAAGGTLAVRAGLWRRSADGLRYAFSELLDDLSLWLALGILAAGAVITLVPADFLATWGSGPLAMVLVLLISVPMYVCATASTPLAHAMLFSGVSPGTVLVFLLAGPASNLASLVIVRRELGGRALAAYLTGVAGVGMLLGLALDALLVATGTELMHGVYQPESVNNGLPVVFSAICLVLMLVAACRPVRRYFLHGMPDRTGTAVDESGYFKRRRSDDIDLLLERGV